MVEAGMLVVAGCIVVVVGVGDVGGVVPVGVDAGCAGVVAGCGVLVADGAAAGVDALLFAGGGAARRCANAEATQHKERMYGIVARSFMRDSPSGNSQTAIGSRRCSLHLESVSNFTEMGCYRVDAVHHAAKMAFSGGEQGLLFGDEQRGFRDRQRESRGRRGTAARRSRKVSVRFDSRFVRPAHLA